LKKRKPQEVEIGASSLGTQHSALVFFSTQSSALVFKQNAKMQDLTPKDPQRMPEKSFIIRLSANAFLFVYFVTEKGNIGRFVVKLNIFRDGVYHEIARYDSGLHQPHMDIIRPDGSKERTIDYGILENDRR